MAVQQLTIRLSDSLYHQVKQRARRTQRSIEDEVAAGAVIGGALGGFVGDWLGAQIGEGVTGVVERAGWREPIIDFIDGAIAQPVSSAINGATNALHSVANQIRMPQLRFGW